MSGKGMVKLVASGVIAAALVGAAMDSAEAWKAKRILTAAAMEGARITVSNSLNSTACSDPTPCSIESAAEAVKQGLLKAGLTQAVCLAPRKPSFSGILVWVFSCGGSPTCGPRGSSLCVEIDRTAVVARGGKWVPSTRVTVRYPQKWATAAAVLPKSLWTSAALPN